MKCLFQPDQKRVYRQTLSKIVIFIVLFFLGGIVTKYIGRQEMRPRIKSANVTEIEEGTLFGENGEITFEGKNFQDIVAVYLNDEWQKDVQAYCDTTESMRIEIPAKFWEKSGEFSVRVERKINAEESIMSNKWTFDVKPIDEEETPIITKIVPEVIECTGEPNKILTIYGKNIQDGDFILAEGVEKEYYVNEDGSCSFLIDFSEYWDKDTLNLCVAKGFHGYPTKNVSKYFLVDIKKRKKPELEYNWLQGNAFIRSSKEIEGNLYTEDLLKLLEQSYNEGYRVFEMNLDFTSDCVLICSVYNNEDPTNVNRGFEEYEIHNLDKSLAQLKEKSFHNTEDFWEICSFLKKNKNAYIIVNVDDKDVNFLYEVFSYITNDTSHIDESILKRLIVQVYNRKMYEQIMQIYPFKSVIYNLKETSDTNEEIISFIQEEGIQAVAISSSQVEDQLLLNSLNDSGCKIYFDSTNSQEYAEFLANKGIYGFYTTAFEKSKEMEERINKKRENYIFLRKNGIDINEMVKTDETYDEKVKQNYLTFLSYLDDLKSKRYVICISVKDEAFPLLTDEVRNKLSTLGLDGTAINDYKMSYGAVIDEGRVQKEIVSKESIELDYETEQGVGIHVGSAHFEKGNYSSIVIDGVEYSKNSRGLNIVVYDKMKRNVVDSICFDTYANYTVLN